MKTKVLYIERRFREFVSIEKVFRQVAESLPGEEFETGFEQLPHGNSVSGILRNLLKYRPARADVYHITGHIHYMALRLPPERTVLTIHDLGFLHTSKGLRRWALKKLFLDWPVARMRYVTAISEATRDEIVSETGCREDKVRVIENPLFEELREREKRPLGGRLPEILQVGTAPHKNLRNLALALAGLECRLRVIGRLSKNEREMLEDLEIDFDNEHGLDEREMLERYQNADLVAFCSTYEGFGLPLIEAQATGTPVVTSDISPLREVAGGGALLVDPASPEEIRKAIKEVLEKEHVRKELVARGRRNVRRFEPRKIGLEYASVYRRITHERNTQDLK